MTVIPSKGSSEGPEFGVCLPHGALLRGGKNTPRQGLSGRNWASVSPVLEWIQGPWLFPVLCFPSQLPRGHRLCSHMSACSFCLIPSYESRQPTDHGPWADTSLSSIRNWFRHSSWNKTTSSLPSLCYAASHSPSAGACHGSDVTRRTLIHSKTWTLWMSWLDFYSQSQSLVLLSG